MQSFLMRQGVEERDYATEIARWRELSALLSKSDADAEQAAFDAVLGVKNYGKPEVKDGEPPAVKEEHPARKGDATRVAEQAMSRSRKAYGYLYAALPSELRPLIADIPQGYAFGIWSFLEKKYRNTEQDSVLALWREFTAMRQTEDESFEEYKARVDSMKELLTNAKQKVETALYASLLIWNLTAKYSTVVLSLKTSEKLKDIENIDWSSIRALIADYERSQNGLGQIDLTSDRGLAARGTTQQRPYVGGQQGKGNKGSQGAKGSDSDSLCFRCGKPNHRVADCYSTKHADGHTLPEKTGQGGSDQKPSHRGADRRGGYRHGRGATGNSNGDANPSARFARDSQAEDSEINNSDQDDNDVPSGRSYVAVVLSGLAMTGTTLHEERNPKKKLSVSLRPMESAYVAGSSAAAAPARAANRVEVRPVDKVKNVVPLDILLRTKGRAIDTGATVHMTGNRESLSSFKRCTPMSIKMADGNIIQASHKGELNIRLAVESPQKEHKEVKVTIPDVYYHERFDANLLSWGKLRKLGWKLMSSSSGTHLITPGGNKAIANTRGDLTIIEDCSLERAYSTQAVKSVMEAKQLVSAHRRLGHISWTRLEKLCKSGLVVGIPSIDALPPKELELAKKEIQECEACVRGKSACVSLGHRGLDKGTRPGQVIHMDTFYVTRRDQVTGKKVTQYCMLATDAYTEWRWADVVTSMTQLTDSAISMLEHCHSMTEKPIRMIICDLGSEFNNKKLQDYCKDKGIQLQPAPPRVKELNGLAEKSVDTVKNHTRTMLHAANIQNGSEYFMALSHHIYLWNRTQIGRRSGKTPYEAMLQRKADTSRTGEFGCDAFVVQHRSERDTTFDPKAQPGIYLGHDGRSNCARVRMLASGKVVIAKDVILREGQFTHLATRLRGQEIEAGTNGSPILHPELYDQSDIESETDSSELKGAESDSEEEPKFPIDQITDSRTKGGVLQYLVKWEGHDVLSWEPASTIDTDAPNEVKQFKESRPSVATDRPTRSSKRLQAKGVSTSSSVASSSDTVADTDDAIGLAAMSAASCL